jgi:type VI secretion system protein VasD
MKLNFWRCLLLLTAATGIISCGGKPLESLKTSPQTRIAVHFEAVADLNPDLNNRPSPLVVRLYELKAPGAFTRADFFSLYAKTDEVLATELVNQEELVIKPGEKRSLEHTLQPETRYIGLLAAYRELDSSEWRTVMTITPQATTSIRVNLGRTGMSARPSAG